MSQEHYEHIATTAGLKSYIAVDETFDDFQKKPTNEITRIEMNGKRNEGRDPQRPHFFA